VLFPDQRTQVFYPFRCDTSAKRVCSYVFAEQIRTVSDKCMCSSGSHGYCPQELTIKSEELNAIYAKVEQNSKKCHTLERNFGD